MQNSFISNFLKSFENAKVGEITIVTPDQKVHHFKADQPGPVCDFIIKDWSVLDRIRNRADIGLGEAYCEGLWESRDVADFLTYCSLNLDSIQNQGSSSLFNKIIFYLYNNFFRLNTKYGSKKNIAKHYDISNTFYSLWLDPTMTYSSALRSKDCKTLEQAQLNKYNRIIDTLSLQGGNVLEIGCGWGGFAEQAAKAGGDVTAITISDKQYQFAKKRLGDTAQILKQDYRELNKIYDYIVSIEMFEAVGEKYWSTYFDKIKSSLAKGGKALIQTITIRDDVFAKYRKDSDYIRHYIFPGGMLPSKLKLYEEINKAKLSAESILEFGHDYAWTLRQWQKSFDEIKKKLIEMEYTPAFLRAWDFYLSICIAGFESKRTDVVQIEISN